MKTRVLSLLLLLSAAGCTASDAARPADADAVYEAVLGEYCCPDHVFLQEVTDTAGLSRANAFSEEVLRGFSPAVRQAVEDLHARSASVHRLPDSAWVSHRDERVSADSARALLQRIQRDRIDRLPNRASVIRVSAVGFSRDRMLAVVQLTDVCGDLCGGITLRAVRRHPGGWVLAEEVWSAVF